MANKKKIGLISILAATLITTALVGSSAKASNGDIWDLKSKTIKYTKLQLQNVTNLLDTMIHWGSDNNVGYGYEVGGRVYNFEDVNNVWLLDRSLASLTIDHASSIVVVQTPPVEFSINNVTTTRDAINLQMDKITITLNSAIAIPPTASDLFVTRIIDGVQDKTTLNRTNIALSPDGKTVTCNVPSIVYTSVAQTVVYLIGFKNTVPIATTTTIVPPAVFFVDSIS